MNSFRKVLLVIIPLVCITSCSSLKPPIQSKEHIELTDKSIKVLNGTYKRSFIGDSSSLSYYNPNLFNDFFIHPNSNGRNNVNGEDFVELLVVGKNKIKITLISNGKILKSKVQKGKIVGHTFQFNRRTFLIPLIVMNYYEERLTRVSILKTGNLNVDTSSQAIGSFIIFPWSGGGFEEYNLEFEKVK